MKQLDKLFSDYRTQHVETKKLPLIVQNLNTQSHIHLGPYSWKILVLRVAPSNTILRKFLEMWVFPLKFKEKILVKKKVIQKAS